MDKILPRYKEDWRSMDQRLTRLEQDDRQSRLAMEADGFRRHQDSRAHGGRRHGNTSDAWG